MKIITVADHLSGSLNTIASKQQNYEKECCGLTSDSNNVTTMSLVMHVVTILRYL